MDIRKILKRWRIALAAMAVALPLGFAFPQAGEKALGLLGINIATILGILPPVFVLLGLFDTWVPRERVAPHLGENSGVKGKVLALFLGAASAGPLYVAFPVAEVLLRKGASIGNIFIFVGAWSTMRIPMILFEIQNMGFVFGLTRYAVSFAGVVVMAYLTERLLGEEERSLLLSRIGE
ncbi:MAG: permease [Aminivibrio sp.]|jgi:uncharacterized membrane protein YraQ (UPF0718 family)